MFMSVHVRRPLHQPKLTALSHEKSSPTCRGGLGRMMGLLRRLGGFVCGFTTKFEDLDQAGVSHSCSHSIHHSIL